MLGANGDLVDADAPTAPSYRWFNWGPRMPPPRRGRANARTHGVAVAGDGSVIIFRQADPAVVVFGANGELRDTWGHQFLGAHGLTLVREGEGEVLWLTDQDSGEVVKTTLGGETLLQLEAPPGSAYDAGEYAPTWVAVFEDRWGGNGDVWVADGYGMSYVHRYDRTGRYLSSINGEEGEAGAFDCPHGLWFDTRHGEPELYIADRGNRRLQVYDPEGTFKRSAGEGALDCPCAGAVYGDELYVPELCARIAILDADDRLVRYLGRNESVCDRPDWPDLPARDLHAGTFNSPHSLAIDGDGSLYVVEWMIGGRITKLERQRDA